MTQLFFDFDGTIADSEQGIVAGIKYFVAQMQLPTLTDDQYRLFIGPTLSSSMHKFYPGLPAAEIKRAIALYQVYYEAHGIYELQLYPGITDVLAQLKQAGFVLNVASTKPEPMLAKIAGHFGLTDYFTGLYGATMDESIRSAKKDVLAYALKKAGAQAADSLMIGDRDTDMVGGAANGVATMGVLYGFGDRAELTAAGANVIVDTPADIPAGIDTALASNARTR
ncbi:HAD hydrolase-like protein [Schleiferilactobacillus shenzhenensis]|uniref:Phosphoglycolate phosphatase n=1 Tax=Schleiferilactobacillus shenzhenensis LY-73 TaxID=1231336 RepID=U4TQA3_9LACO|nr:HAD hydrolase-like protein [Schleiferilactobacillus shenzhenensis]ERL65630.1 phosphoglycolate phosphatase [Schleiferilactobacillus shenzhenensis LY-73]